tara:strand:+ start:1399 stop:2391 length:993 start_codon:yes stop_codon:yes gene_type:complete
MIIKSHENNKINFKLFNFFLLYGQNDGLKKELSSALNCTENNIFNYDEKEILDNPNIFLENAISTSLFEDKKLIIIKRASEKIFKIIEKIINKNIRDIKIIIEADNLEKKSKLRSFFEKSDMCACIALYADNQQTLTRLVHNFIREKKISISSEDINAIVSKTNGDRGLLKNELNKIEIFCANKKRISSDEISKLTNLTENHSVVELIDNCLAKNNKKIIKILNENNFSKEDSILIIRTFLNKAKKILNLTNQFKENNNLDLTISSAKPPIFWKDKDITKKQILEWTPKHVIRLIENINEIELQIKKNLDISLNLVSDFILSQSITRTNN